MNRNVTSRHIEVEKPTRARVSRDGVMTVMVSCICRLREAFIRRSHEMCWPETGRRDQWLCVTTEVVKSDCELEFKHLLNHSCATTRCFSATRVEARRRPAGREQRCMQ